MFPPFRLLTSFLLAMVFAAPLEPASAEYLHSEHVAFLLNRGAYMTSLPLDPTHQYEITFTSSYTLRPLLDYQGHCCSQLLFFKTCYLPLKINLAFAPLLWSGSYAFKNGVHATYFLDPNTNHHYVPTIRLFVWGNGQRLMLQSTADFTSAIPTLTTEVVDLLFKEEQERIAQEQRRQEAERAELERKVAEQARQEQSFRDLKAFLGSLLVPGAAVVGVLVLGIVLVRLTSPARQRARVARLGRQIERELQVLDYIKKGLNDGEPLSL